MNALQWCKLLNNNSIEGNRYLEEVRKVNFILRKS